MVSQADAAIALRFPIASFLWFVAGAVLLRLLSMTAWVFFPGDGAGPQVARIVIPAAFSIGLLLLNCRLLARGGFGSDPLGLRPTPRRAGAVFAGTGAIVVLLLAMAVAVWWWVPFHYQRGPLGFGTLVLRAAEYLGGNTGEELIFRGYVLLLLQRHYGAVSALFITSLLFGLFHLPGLSGLPAIKMICTTFLGGWLYAIGFLLTGTLWTAIAMHVMGNVVLHHVLGLSGQPSLLTPVLERPWPTDHDPAFLIWIGILVPIAVAATLPLRRTARDLPR